jgi:hypothetical protein
MDTENTFVSVETLDKLFQKESPKKTIRIDGKCSMCSKRVEIVITKTSEGYGFQGGVLYEPKSGKFKFRCEQCFKKGS